MRAGTLAAILVATGAALAGCAPPPDPCPIALGAPTAKQIAAAAEDTTVEIEKELPNGTECIVVGTSWVDATRLPDD
jgi:uncharacterized lipoprotein YbaY